MRVKRFISVEKMLDERYGVDRGGFFEVSGLTLSISRENYGDWSPYDIFYSDKLVINGKIVRVCFAIFLNPRINWWQMKDYTRTNKVLKETEEYQDLKSRLFAQFVLWCIEDNLELLKGGAEK